MMVEGYGRSIDDYRSMKIEEMEFFDESGKNFTEEIGVSRRFEVGIEAPESDKMILLWFTLSVRKEGKDKYVPSKQRWLTPVEIVQSVTVRDKSEPAKTLNSICALFTVIPIDKRLHVENHSACSFIHF